MKEECFVVLDTSSVTRSINGQKWEEYNDLKRQVTKHLSISFPQFSHCIKIWVIRKLVSNDNLRHKWKVDVSVLLKLLYKRHKSDLFQIKFDFTSNNFILLLHQNPFWKFPYINLVFYFHLLFSYNIHSLTIISCSINYNLYSTALSCLLGTTIFGTSLGYIFDFQHYALKPLYFLYRQTFIGSV